jgi:predicted GIY-YIG superfamily endonuclease
MKTYKDTRENYINYSWNFEEKYMSKYGHLQYEFRPKQGLYLLVNEGEIVYIGFSLNLQQRIKSHSSNSSNKTWTDVFMIEMPEDNKESIMFYEKQLINEYKPKYNILS